VPHTPDFLCSFVGSLNFMRLSLKKGAHAVLARAAYRKFGASRSFFARCGIPQALPSSLSRHDGSYFSNAYSACLDDAGKNRRCRFARGAI
jgi:hypothetical protein